MLLCSDKASANVNIISRRKANFKANAKFKRYVKCQVHIPVYVAYITETDLHYQKDWHDICTDYQLAPAKMVHVRLY